jgi:hypothetical protein
MRFVIVITTVLLGGCVTNYTFIGKNFPMCMPKEEYVDYLGVKQFQGKEVYAYYLYDKTRYYLFETDPEHNCRLNKIVDQHGIVYAKEHYGITMTDIVRTETSGRRKPEYKIRDTRGTVIGTIREN